MIQFVYRGAIVALLSVPVVVAAQNSVAPTATPSENAQQPNRLHEAGRSAGKIASQPVRDVGMARTNIPLAMQKASEAPYSLTGLKSCADISRAFSELTTVIGPDFKAGDIPKENKAGKLAEAGGKTIVNSLIPFRGLVREVSGAAPAQRRFDRAVTASVARRGFLRGLHQARKCRTKLF